MRCPHRHWAMEPYLTSEHRTSRRRARQPRWDGRCCRDHEDQLHRRHRRPHRLERRGRWDRSPSITRVPTAGPRPQRLSRRQLRDVSRGRRAASRTEFVIGAKFRCTVRARGFMFTTSSGFIVAPHFLQNLSSGMPSARHDGQVQPLWRNWRNREERRAASLAGVDAVDEVARDSVTKVSAPPQPAPVRPHEVPVRATEPSRSVASGRDVRHTHGACRA